MMNNYWLKLGLSIMLWMILKSISPIDLVDNLFYWAGASIFINANNKKAVQ